MKKLFAIFLSFSIAASMVTAAGAAVTEIDDDLSDLTKLAEYSDNLELEVKDKLGNYENPQYVTSGVGTMELVYNLEQLSSFEVVTLNYRDTEDIKFYVSSEADAEYKEITDYSSNKEDLGSSWSKITYYADVNEDADYFKIVINQTRAKYIRLDNVKLLTDLELELIGAAFYDAEGMKAEDGNMYKVTSLELEFNQRVNDAGMLRITGSGGDEYSVEGRVSESGTKAVYSFGELEFDIYEFDASVTTSTGKEYVYSAKEGYAPVIEIGEYIHFEDDLNTESFITGIIDEEGNNYEVGEYNLTSLDETIISAEEGKIVPHKAGKTVLSASFVFDGKDITVNKEIEVCGVKTLNVSPETLTLAIGEEQALSAELELTDGTVIVPGNIKAESLDSSVASVNSMSVKGKSKGNTYVTVTADYNGEIIEKTISVGVEQEPQEILSGVELAVNRDNIYVGESLYAVIKGRFENGGEADLMSGEKRYYSSDESVLTISDDGKITAENPGTAGVYAEVILEGIAVKSDTVSITVKENSIDNAKLYFETLNLLVGDSMDISLKAFDKSGNIIENPQVRYSLSNDNFILNGNVLTAAKPGETVISATVSYNGTSVKTAEYNLSAKEYLNETTKQFNVTNDWSGTFDHSSELIINSSLGMVTSGTNSPEQYVIFKAEGEVIGLTAETTVSGDKAEDDFRIYISGDNSGYERIEEAEFEITSEDAGRGAFKYVYSIMSDKLKGAAYIKIVLDKQTGSTQDIRLNSVSIQYNNAPEVMGVDTFTRSQEVTKVNDIRKIVVSFSQEIDPDSVDGILVKNSDEELQDFDIICDKNLINLNFDELSDGEYILELTGVKNKFGLVMQDFSYEFEVKNNEIDVSLTEFAQGKVSAKITNGFDSSITACIITCLYDDSGVLADMYIDKDVEIAGGVYDYLCPKLFESGNEKVYVWSNMTDMFVY